MAKLGSLEDINRHAQEQIKKAVDSGQIMPDADAAAQAAAVPTFSAGTIAVDPNTGRAVVPPSASETPAIGGETTIAPDATGALSTDAGQASGDAGAAQEAAAAGAADAARERDAQGRFKGQPGEEKPAAKPAPAAAAPKTEEQREEAADVAAAQILEEWADLRYQADDGTEYAVRALKGKEQVIERALMRRQNYDRATSYLDRWKPVLAPLVADGSLERIYPLMNEALQNREFGEAVIQLYNRHVTGQPLLTVAPAGNGVPTGAAPAPAPETGSYLAEADPWLAEQISPLDRRLAAIEQRTQTWEQQQEAQRQAQAREAREQNERGQQVAYAHADISRRYPDEYSGDLNRDQAAFQRVVAYARNARYVDTYGVRAGIVLAADALRAERADTGSPAAALVNQIDQATMNAAARQAASARSVGGGTAAAAPAPRQRPLTPPTVHNPDGTRKTMEQFKRESLAYSQQVSAGAA